MISGREMNGLVGDATGCAAPFPGCGRAGNGRASPNPGSNGLAICSTCGRSSGRRGSRGRSVEGGFRSTLDFRSRFDPVSTCKTLAVTLGVTLGGCAEGAVGNSNDGSHMKELAVTFAVHRNSSLFSGFDLWLLLQCGHEW